MKEEKLKEETEIRKNLEQLLKKEKSAELKYQQALQKKKGLPEGDTSEVPSKSYVRKSLDNASEVLERNEKKASLEPVRRVAKRKKNKQKESNKGRERKGEEEQKRNNGGREKGDKEDREKYYDPDSEF